MEVVAHATIVGVSVYLGLPLYLFFCLLCGSYVAHLGAL